MKNKAPGTNRIPSEFYKYSHGILYKPLKVLFDHSLNILSYPSPWFRGLINPLHKQESPTLPDNYRKIIITPAIGKIFDGILNNRLPFAKERLSMGDPLQNGFKPNTSAIDNVFLLNGIIDKCKANGRPLYTSFVDFKSAFDLINQSALLFKLVNHGCVGTFYLWFIFLMAFLGESGRYPLIARQEKLSDIGWNWRQFQPQIHWELYMMNCIVEVWPAIQHVVAMFENYWNPSDLVIYGKITKHFCGKYKPTQVIIQSWTWTLLYQKLVERHKYCWKHPILEPILCLKKNSVWKPIFVHAY